MLNPFYDFYCHEPNTGELVSRMLVFEYEYITRTGAIFVIMISLSLPGSMGSKMQ